MQAMVPGYRLCSVQLHKCCMLTHSDNVLNVVLFDPLSLPPLGQRGWPQETPPVPTAAPRYALHTCRVRTATTLTGQDTATLTGHYTQPHSQDRTHSHTHRTDTHTRVCTCTGNRRNHLQSFYMMAHTD